tara:strand:- start:401 stop:601 length:201 start_codon:yes stop_codon:yes gene_type:complete
LFILILAGFFLIAYNVVVYGKLRVCAQGISEGNSDVANVQRPFVEPKISNFLYTLLGTGFFRSVYF